MESVYDRAVSEVGQEGKFQKKFDFIYNVILAAFWSVTYNSIILILVIVSHTCHVPEKNENISDAMWKSKFIPEEENFAGQIKFSSCLIYVNSTENNDTKACDTYDYDRTWYESTIPTENNWVCENELLGAKIFSYSRIGEGIGSLVFGWFGDVYGRKLTYVISLAFLFFGRVLSILASHSYAWFALGCIIASFPSFSAVQSTAIISIEISSNKRRSAMAKIRLVAESFGLGFMPFLYWWLRDWKLFASITTVMLLPFLLFSWKIMESPRWLWLAGKTKDCVKELKRIAKVNNRKLDADVEREILSSTPIKKLETFKPIALFYGRRLATNTILQLCFWLCISLNYNVILMRSGEKSDGNPFLEITWQCLCEVPAYFLAAWLADRIGRRFTGVTSLCLTATIWSLFSLREMSTTGWIKSAWFGTLLVIINKISLTISYYIINLFNMELYPTCLRQSGMSFGNVISGCGSAIAPYVLYFGRHFDTRLPGAIMAIISLLGALVSFCLPETLNIKLPETLEDAREFGNNQKYFSIHQISTGAEENNPYE